MVSTFCRAALVALLLCIPAPAVQAETQRAAMAAEALFQAGLAALDQGEPRPAIRAFRQLLAADPALVRVRLELARALFAAGDFDASRREFQTVLSGDLPPEVRRNVLIFLRAIEARSGLDWSFSASLRPNLGGFRRTVTDEIELDVLGQRRVFRLQRRDPPPFVLRVDAAADWRQDVGLVAGQPATLSLGGFAAVEDAPGVADDDQRLGLRAGLRVNYPRLTVGAGPVASLRRVGGDLFELRAGGEASAQARRADGLTLFGGLAVEGVDNRVTSARDGVSGRGRLGAASSFGGRGSAGGAVTVERFGAVAASESFQRIGLEMFGDADLTRGLRIDGALRLQWLGYDAAAPLLIRRRIDREASFSVRATAQTITILDRFSPFVEVTGTARRSSIRAFGSDELGFGFGFVRTL